MIKSIKQGVFFDNKYWTGHLKDGLVLKPIYFSSLIAGNSLRKCASIHRVGLSGGDRTRPEGIVYSNSQDKVIARPTGESDGESDCESDSTEAGQDQVQDGRVRAILTPGSFAA